MVVGMMCVFTIDKHNGELIVSEFLMSQLAVEDVGDDKPNVDVFAAAVLLSLPPSAIVA